MNTIKSVIARGALGLGLAAAGTGAAHATSAVWDVSWTPSGWTRGSTAGSIYGEWNVFTDDADPALIVDNTPEVGSFPGRQSFSLTETTGTAFITSGGNIYSFAAPTAFTFNVGGSGAPGARDVYLHIGSLGNFDPQTNRSFTNFTLNGINGTYTELFRAALGGTFGGTEVESLISWKHVPNAASFALAWNAIGSSVSLDQLSADFSPVTAAPVPLPPAVWLLGSALTGLVGIGRRRDTAAA